jgi:hypothetical protein
MRLPAPLPLALTLALTSLGLPAIAQAAEPAQPVQPAPSIDSMPAPQPAEAAQPSESPWAGSLELYGFVPIHTTGSTTVKGFTADTDIWLPAAIPLIQMAASGRGSVEYGRFGFLSDLSYSRIGDSVSRTSRRGRFTGKATVTSELGLYDFALRYRLGERESAVARTGSWSLIPYAGVRLVDTSLGVEAELRGNGPFGLRLERQGELSRTWAQPLLGTQATYFLTPRLRAFGRADIGGFGLAGARDLSGNAQLGLGYAVGNRTDLNLSWRYLGLAFDNGASRPNGFSTYQNGVEVGLKFFF